MNRALTWLFGHNVCAAIVALSSVARATPPPSSEPNHPPPPQPFTDAQSAGPAVPPQNLPDSPFARYPNGDDDQDSYDTRADILPYKEGKKIPPGYKVQEKVRLGLVIPGSILFGVGYVPAAFLGAGELSYGNAVGATLLIPVVGPFIAIGAGPSAGPIAGIFIIDGLLQAAGAALLIPGLTSKNKVLVKQNVAMIPRPDVFVGPGSIRMKFSF